MNDNWTVDNFLKEYNIDLENIEYDELSKLIGSLPDQKSAPCPAPPPGPFPGPQW